MKTYEQLTKKKLIEFIVEIRPKADAYDRVCESLGISHDISGYIKTLKKKTIPDEIYAQLIDLSTELKTQDRRGTADPYVYELRDKEEVPTSDDYSDLFVYYEPGGDSHSTTIKQVREKLNNYYDTEEYSDEKKYSDEEIEQIAYTDLQIRRAYYLEKDIVKNVFLTRKALDEHLSANRHHYDKPFNYVVHLFRNPEMELVITFLKSLTQ
jgi:hypothetical protein